MMIKMSIFLPLFMGASLVLAVPRTLNAELVARSPGEVLSDYESIVIDGGIPGVIQNAPLTLYNQLTYAGFRAVHKIGTGVIFEQIHGEYCTVAINGSSLTSVYLASPVAYLKPNYAYFGCFLSTSSGVSPGVSCTVQVTAYQTDGTTYVDKAGCAYDGLGMIQQCTFPSTWNNVAKLSFDVIASEILASGAPILGSLLGGLIGSVGSIAIIMDDFDAIFKCIPGKTNSVVAPALCV
ncbi:hypothetical protein NHQ30_002050 [Ciborinia camelliae]|nr:hypothetical protein NHQ30_002050 [Ciborinia camelliae]